MEEGGEEVLRRGWDRVYLSGWRRDRLHLKAKVVFCKEYFKDNNRNYRWAV